MDFFSWILINLKWIILFFVALLMLASGMYLSPSFGWFGCLLILFLLWGWMSFGGG